MLRETSAENNNASIKVGFGGLPERYGTSWGLWIETVRIRLIARSSGGPAAIVDNRIRPLTTQRCFAVCYAHP